MHPITSFSELTKHLQNTNERKHLVVVNPSDSQTFGAILRAVDAGLVHVTMLGDSAHYDMKLIDAHSMLKFIECKDLKEASERAVAMVKKGDGDILMKGLVNTDVLLKAILHKEHGLVPYGNVVTFIAAMEIPGYPKLLFMTDPAVIPAPNLRQRRAMIEYAIRMTSSFGISKPKIALLHGTEKPNPKLNFMDDYALIIEEARKGVFGEAIVDGPLDIFLALNPELGAIKKVSSPIQGDADVVIFPGFEAANVFYKTVITFAGAEMGGILFGTEKPVVMTSRSDSAASKFNSIALAGIF
jgi:phosphate butyryltransferase